MSSLLASATAAAASAAHAAATSVLAVPQIKPGHKVPSVPVKEDDPDKTISLAALPGRVLIVGVPGAFTPACSSHVPGFLSSYSQLSTKGVRAIYVVAVNDAFVTKAWKDHLAKNATSVHFIADDKGAFTASLGLLLDATPLLGGPRSKRYVLVVDDGTVSAVHVEENPADVKETAADHILASL